MYGPEFPGPKRSRSGTVGCCIVCQEECILNGAKSADVWRAGEAGDKPYKCEMI